jgi:hypothetical protein
LVEARVSLNTLSLPCLLFQDEILVVRDMHLDINIDIDIGE